MMLLNIYLATTVASVAIDFTKSLSTKKNLLKKGYEFSNKKQKVNLFSTLANVFVPGLNLAMAYKLLTQDESKLEEELLRRGTIFKPEEQKKTDTTYVEPVINTERVEEQTQATVTAKTYEEMTTEEKREFLLRQRETLLRDLCQTEEEINTLGRNR